MCGGRSIDRDGLSPLVRISCGASSLAIPSLVSVMMMVSFPLQRSLLLVAGTLALPGLASPYSKHAHTVTTTIPYIGKATPCTTTLPECQGTVKVVVETPLPYQCRKADPHPPGHPCRTITTTIPYIGKPTPSKTTLPECHGTVLVAVQTPLPCSCPTKITSTSTGVPTVSVSKLSTVSIPTGTLPTVSISTLSTVSIPGVVSSSSSATTTSTSTSTSSSTSTSPSATVPALACGNVNPACAASGFNVDYYANQLGGYSDPYNEVYSNYYIVQGLSPLTSSLTSTIFFPQNTQPGSGGIYPNSSIEVGPYSYTQFPYFPGFTRSTSGGIVVDANNYTLVYSGYFRAPSSGQWRICASADNENDIYFGDGNAFSCLDGSTGTAADPLVKCSGGYFNNAPQCASVTLVSGAYYPIRAVMGNWQGPSAFNMTMVPPGTDPTAGSNDWTGLAFPTECRVSVP